MQENHLEEVCLDWLQGLGWARMHGEALASGGSEAAALLVERIHPGSDAICALAEPRDSLLPRLISGKLRLPEAVAVIEEVTA
jgi:hypothetical protein